MGMRKILLGAVLLVGCAHQWSEPVPGPNGLAYSVGCKRGIERCYREAQRLCPGGYSLLDRSGGEVSGFVATSPTTAVATHHATKILVECRPATASR